MHMISKWLLRNPLQADTNFGVCDDVPKEHNHAPDVKVL